MQTPMSSETGLIYEGNKDTGKEPVITDVNLMISFENKQLKLLEIISENRIPKVLHYKSKGKTFQRYPAPALTIVTSSNHNRSRNFYMITKF